MKVGVMDVMKGQFGNHMSIIIVVGNATGAIFFFCATNEKQGENKEKRYLIQKQKRKNIQWS